MNNWKMYLNTPNPRVVVVVTISVVVEKIRHRRYSLRRHKFVKKVMRNLKFQSLREYKDWMHLGDCK